MGYYLKTALGALLFLGSVVAFNVALLNLLETGTCASGNQPFVVADECPSDTGKWAGILTGSIFAGLIGAGVFAFRGDRPGGSGESVAGGFLGWAGFAWGLFFGGTGIATLIGSLAGDLPDDGKTGGLIVGVTFALMGLPVLLFALKGIAGNLFSRSAERPAAATAAGAPASASASTLFGAMRTAGDASTKTDVIDRIARLDELRRSGALTQSEFDREKAKLLAES